MFFCENKYRLFICENRVDMRKSYNGLIELIKSELCKDPMGNLIFSFINKRGNQIKLFFWDRTGFCILSKKLEVGKFNFNKKGEVEYDQKELRIILDGIAKRLKK